MDQHRHILIVDDDERVLLVLSRALRALGDGYRVETARSGEEALRKAKVGPYDIVITDIVMPGMDGVELTRAIKDLHPDTVVIWITARDCYRLQPDRKRLHAYRCLEKPLGVVEIRQVVVAAAVTLKLEKERAMAPAQGSRVAVLAEDDCEDREL